MLVYSTLTFHNLGNRQSPQTAWTSEESAFIDFGYLQYISRFQFMTGARFDVPFMLFASEDGEDWTFSMQVDASGVFEWQERHISVWAKYVQIVPFGYGVRLQEIAFRDPFNRLIVPFNLTNAQNLFDEQHLAPLTSSFINSFYFDEIFHARAGYEYLHRLQVLETTHPPMGKNLIAAGIRTFGMTPFGWRFAGTMSGILMIPLMYIFGTMMFRSHYWGAFCAFIFAFDFMTFAQTRIATIDSYVVLFIIASYLCMYAYVRDSEDNPLWKSLLSLAGSGLFIGLAIASKWQGFYALAGLPFLFFPAWYKVFKRGQKEAFITFALCFVFFIAIPITVYVLSYIPFVRAMDDGSGFFATIIANQHHMFSYHSELTEWHPFASRWWEWPLIVRPIFYYMNIIDHDLRQGISSFGNPAVWWMGIAATVYAITKFKDTKDRQILIFLFISYAAQFVPWVFVNRATFIYHYFPSVPFVVLLIAFFFKDYVAPKSNRLVLAYGALVFLLFMLFYPVLSGTPVQLSFVETFLRWFPAWILV